jgi:hypothetical protein
VLESVTHETVEDWIRRLAPEHIQDADRRSMALGLAMASDLDAS